MPTIDNLGSVAGSLLPTLGAALKCLQGLSILLLLALASCQKKTTPIPQFDSQSVPTSERSKAVEQQVAPKLIAELQASGLEYGAPIFIRLFKLENELEVWLHDGGQFQHFRNYKIAAWSGQVGPKLKEGDLQSPEGFYSVPPSNMNPHSNYHLSFNLGFPNEYDRAHGYTGSYLMVHGSIYSIGCYAMTNKNIEEIYTLANAALANGQPAFAVHCFPFHMTLENLATHHDSPWYPFWQNLKQGYDYFELTRQVPTVSVHDKLYRFN